MKAVPLMGDERDPLIAEVFALQDELRVYAEELVSKIVECHDLTLQQIRVMERLYSNPGMSIQELSRRLGVSAPTASGLVDRLVDKGMVERIDDKKDRRIRRIFPSPLGQEFTAAIGSLFGNVLARVVSVLDIADLELLKRSTEVVLAAVARVSQEADDGEPV
ncbi:MAG: MarR family transcriptional regulator [Propionibacteriaceae bacterium]|jgi:DNA-binding MarR family transcriptional regulator|nr:MarR family transcriptional regulator [Propionibacteriaceae bacterium]